MENNHSLRLLLIKFNRLVTIVFLIVKTKQLQQVDFNYAKPLKL